MAEETNSWTEERLEKLKILWNEGLSISQIGEEMGVTRNAIAGKAHRLGLPKRQSPISKSSAKSASKAAAKSAPKAAPAEELKPTKELPLRLALRNIHWSRSKCMWPTGDPKTVSFSFCGERIEPGKPYCSEHCALAYTNSRENS